MNLANIEQLFGRKSSFCPAIYEIIHRLGELHLIRKKIIGTKTRNKKKMYCKLTEQSNANNRK